MQIRTLYPELKVFDKLPASRLHDLLVGVTVKPTDNGLSQSITKDGNSQNLLKKGNIFNITVVNTNFISKHVNNPARIAATLVHEAIHARHKKNPKYLYRILLEKPQKVDYWQTWTERMELERVRRRHTILS